MNISINKQSSIKIIDDKIIYFDPYNITDEIKDADFIFITHDHYDHFDEKSIRNIINRTTMLIIPRDMEESARRLTSNYKVIDPGCRYEISGLRFETVPAYNIKKRYHPKSKRYIGYIVEIGNKRVYAMGDTDRTPDIDEVKCDICFVPIGGTYTMNCEEAVNYINHIKPNLAIPIHYGSIVGDTSLGEQFKNKIDNSIKVELYIK